MKMCEDKPLIVMALESESQGLLEELGYEVIYCGVGKVNATYHLTRFLYDTKVSEREFSYILNFGSAGSSRFPKGALAAANEFLQRDMNATGLGFLHGETPFDISPRMVSMAPRFTYLTHGLCSSGDSFLQGPCPVKGEIIDMEAYALAKVCSLESIPFACVKYITDSADGEASKEWNTNLMHAASAFASFLKDLE